MEITAKGQARSDAAKKGVATRVRRMKEGMETVEITIVRGLTDLEIYGIASRSHGGNYMGDPGPFRWSNEKARNAIRHRLTNYEDQWARINRGSTGAHAYRILRERVEAVVDQAYPQFAPGHRRSIIPCPRARGIERQGIMSLGRERGLTTRVSRYVSGAKMTNTRYI